ncbi:MFS transporter [Bacillus sp. 179-C3.3 HS]|uniref:MFS transporter n=1 Tax=Bacillus sp. 179-C3.3 HS TaxID=3232162 RepID=UPI0039A1B041
MRNQPQLLILILTIGVFGILNTEMGFIGILPDIAAFYDVHVSTAGWLVSVFAIGVAVSGLTMPLLLSRYNRKKVMLLVLSIFVVGNIISIFTTHFTVLMLARIIPALFHPVYCALAFSIAAESVSKEEAPKAVSKVFVGVSAGMVVGVPVVSLIASVSNLQMAMAFFAVTNLLVLIATLIWIPSMPVQVRRTHGEQLNILTKSKPWFSIIFVILLNAAIFGVYSYLAEYLQSVSQVSANLSSLLLFIYGVANIIGNVAAGKLLTLHAKRIIIMTPIMLSTVYVFLFLAAQQTFLMILIILLWGILAGIGALVNQYVVTSAAPEAPDFANGIFLSSTNIGTVIGTILGGYFISNMGIQYVVFVGIISAGLSLLVISMRHHRTKTDQL